MRIFWDPPASTPSPQVSTIYCSHAVVLTYIYANTHSRHDSLLFAGVIYSMSYPNTVTTNRSQDSCHERAGRYGCPTDLRSNWCSSLTFSSNALVSYALRYPIGRFSWILYRFFGRVLPYFCIGIPTRECQVALHHLELLSAPIHRHVSGHAVTIAISNRLQSIWSLFKYHFNIQTELL